MPDLLVYTGCTLMMQSPVGMPSNPGPGMVMFMPPPPGMMLGTSAALVTGGGPICVEGDEIPPAWKVPCIQYVFTAPQPPAVSPGPPGMAMVSKVLQKPSYSKATIGDKKVILATTPFVVEVMAVMPAMGLMPNGVPKPDTALKWKMNVQFVPPPLMINAPTSW